MIKKYKIIFDSLIAWVLLLFRKRNKYLAKKYVEFRKILAKN